MPPSLTLCMIARNEAPVLPRCLASVQGLAHHVVIADTGSTDDTPAIAAQHGAEVLHIPWTNDFAAARNASLSPARTPWILVLDADEWLTPANATRIADLAAAPPEHAYYLDQKNTEPSGHTTRNALVRLFPNRPEVRFRHPVHEDVVSSLTAASIPIKHTSIEIEHAGYTDPATLAAKVARNKAILETSLAEATNPASEPHLRFHLGCVLSGEGHLEEALTHFDWCIAHAPPTSRIASISRLHAAECHRHAHRPREALALLPSEPSPQSHPAALMMVAQILHADSPASARPWLEALLDTPDQPHYPPAPLASLKLGAVAALARAWLEAGRPDAAQRLLDLANRMKSRSVDPASPAIGALYRDITAA
jgi:hypothetical protein